MVRSFYVAMARCVEWRDLIQLQWQQWDRCLHALQLCCGRFQLCVPVSLFIIANEHLMDALADHDFCIGTKMVFHFDACLIGWAGRSVDRSMGEGASLQTALA